MTLPELGYVIMINNFRPEIPDTYKDIQALRAALETVGFNVTDFFDCSVEVGINASMFEILLHRLNSLNKD